MIRNTLKLDMIASIRSGRYRYPKNIFATRSFSKSSIELKPTTPSNIPGNSSKSFLIQDQVGNEIKPRKYWKHFLKSKRDEAGVASRVSVFFHEVQEALDIFNSTNQLDLAVKDLEIPSDLAELYSQPGLMNSIAHEVEVIYLTSNGDGLCFVPRQSYLNDQAQAGHTVVRVPKAIPGDIIDVKIGRHMAIHSEGELVKVLNSRSRLTRRNDRLIVCSNFDQCSGCQLQMMNNDDQLRFKQSVIQRAFKFYYPSLYEEFKAKRADGFGSVMDSPMQYSYRTKITPHFKPRRDVKPLDTKIGFNDIHDPVGIVDIDHCPIATPLINQEFPKLKSKVLEELDRVQINKMLTKQRIKAKISPTLFLRDSIRLDHKTGDFDQVCITDTGKVVTEKVGDFVFQFEASEFFQNNSYILPQVIDYIKYHIHESNLNFKYIVDTYCGSGFFGISLSKEVPEKDGKIFGIEISKKSIKYAEHNASLNGLKLPEKAEFIAGNSEDLFSNQVFADSQVTGDKSILIMDPSRKGSNESFLKQLLKFKPMMVVYISCNPFTQARDLQMLNLLQQDGPVQYEVQDVVGFDFFPQTKHVESVAILKRII